MYHLKPFGLHLKSARVAKSQKIKLKKKLFPYNQWQPSLFKLYVMGFETDLKSQVAINEAISAFCWVKVSNYIISVCGLILFYKPCSNLKYMISVEQILN